MVNKQIIKIHGECKIRAMEKRKQGREIGREGPRMPHRGPETLQAEGAAGAKVQRRGGANTVRTSREAGAAGREE